MYACQANFSFSLIIAILFASSAFIFGYIAERNSVAVFRAPSVACTYSLWLILITTVGYGDYFPQTPLGRIIIFLVAIWGTFIASITVVVVANIIKIEKKEKEGSIVIQKLYIRSEVRESGQTHRIFSANEESLLQTRFLKTWKISHRGEKGEEIVQQVAEKA